MLKVASICSGIGAPEAAWTPLGFQFIFSSEIEPFPCAVLQHHYPHVPNLGDMTKFQDWPERCDCPQPILAPFEFTIGGNTLKIYVCTKCHGITIDVLVGGTPCQSFSVAGLRKGLSDPRGNLALVFLAIVRKYRPTWVVWENVPGVHSSWTDDTTHPATETSCDPIAKALLALLDAGLDPGPDFGPGQFEECDQTNDFDCFLAGLAELQYGLATKIYDAQYFGVAQRRRRVFVIGHIGRQWQRAAAVLFERESLRGNPPPRRQTRERIAPTISARPTGGGGLGTDFDLDGGVIPICSPHNPTPNLNLNPPTDVFAFQPRIARNGRGEMGELVNALQAESGETGKGDAAPCVVVSLEPLKYGIPETQWHEMANYNDFEQIKRYGTTRARLMEQAICGRVVDCAPTLRSGGNKTGGDRPPGTDVDTADSLIPEIAYTLQERDSKGSDSKGSDSKGSDSKGSDSKGSDSKGSDSNTKEGHLIPVENTRQKQYSEASIQCSEEEPIAFPGTLSGTQRIKTENLSPSIGSANPTAVTQRMAVRRLTPRECERLQGFPDDYTRIPSLFLSKLGIDPDPAQDKHWSADGPRYKALGNSMAEPNIRWIGERLEQVHAIPMLTVVS